MMAAMLKGLGYEPVGYCDPTAALQVLREDPGALPLSSPMRRCRA